MSNRYSLAGRMLRASIGLAIVWWASNVYHVNADDKHERGRMEDIMDVVAKDIQRKFYDPKLKGVDWKTISERARQRIRQADHLGDMLAAIASVPYQLYDSHTYFIPPGRSAKVDYGFEAEPFAKDILVYKLKKDGPAIKAGLQLGDKIVAMYGFAAKRENFFEMTRYFEFLNPATELTLEIERGNDPPRTIKIPAKVEQRGQGYLMDYNAIRQMIDAQEPIYKHQNYEGNVGYLKLRAFMLSPGGVEAMLHRVKNSSAVIIDLRGNGGGAEETLTALAGFFSDQPYEMATQVGRDKTESLKVKPRTPRIVAPAVVMLDDESASASEMFARDMQIRKKAVVIGDNSGGRVNRAQIFWEKVGAHDMVGFGIEIAVSKVVMEDGEELENHGVTPDEFCVPTTKDLHDEKDICLDKALELARTAAAHTSQE
jgi:carboxyl-terminal processing protease